MKKVSLIILLLVCGLKLQSQTSKATIKSWFETGDVPTQTQFWNFIDNSYNEVTDDLLKGQGFPTIKYSPFTVKTPGKIYSGTVNPSSSNRLNYDGYFYATKFYNAAGQEITPGTAVDTANSTTSGLVSPYRYGYWNGKLDRSKYISDTSSRRKVMTRKAVDSLIAISTTGKVSYIGTYNPSGNTFPTTGSGGGIIKKGDYWDLSGSGTLGGVAVDNTMSIISRIDNPGQTLANWDLQGQVVQQAVARTAGDVGEGYLKYSGTTLVDGQFFGSDITATGTKIGGFNGYFNVNRLNANSLSNFYQGLNIASSSNTLPTLNITNNNNKGILISQGTAGTGIPFAISIGGAVNHYTVNPNASASTTPYANDTYVTHTSGNLEEWKNNTSLKASIDYTGRGVFKNGLALETIGGSTCLNISGNQAAQLSAVINITNNASGWGSRNSSGGASFYAQNDAAGTGDFYQGWKESIKVFSVDKDGKLTATAINLGTYSGSTYAFDLTNSGANYGTHVTNTGSGVGSYTSNTYSTGTAHQVACTAGNGIVIQTVGNAIPFKIDSAGVSTRATFEADGTLVFSGNATVWEDENIDPTTLTGGGSLPTATTWGSTSISAAGFAATGVTQVQGTREIWHKTKLGSTIYPHIHWAANTTNVGVVRWGFEYFFVYEGSGAVTTSTIIYVETSTTGTAWDKINSNFAGITIPNVLGAQLHFRFFRDGSNANDTFTGIAVSETMGYHYEIDQLGSKTTSTK